MLKEVLPNILLTICSVKLSMKHKGKMFYYKEKAKLTIVERKVSN